MSDSRRRRLRDRTSGPATLISEGCKIDGRISGEGEFLINGHIDGECDVDGTLTIARGGIWTGTIRAINVIVAGQIDGDIVASGDVEITDSAKIAGTVTGEAIAVAEGAVVDGVMKTTGKAAPREFVEKRNDD